MAVDRSKRAGALAAALIFVERQPRALMLCEHAGGGYLGYIAMNVALNGGKPTASKPPRRRPSRSAPVIRE
jgi:hypothetical protein